MELADGVYSIPVTVEMQGQERTFNHAAVETGTGLLLVDVGLPGQVGALEDALGQHGFGLDDVSLVVLTHHDGDHAGCLAEVRERTDAPVFAHVDEAPYVDGREFPVKASGDRYPPAPVDVEVVDGVRFATEAGSLEVVATPGHSPGHCSLYLPDERLLVAGDALTAPTGELAGPNEEYTPDMDRALESAGRLADLDVAATLCFHGGFVEQGSERIAEISRG